MATLSSSLVAHSEQISLLKVAEIHKTQIDTCSRVVQCHDEVGGPIVSCSFPQFSAKRAVNWRIVPECSRLERIYSGKGFKCCPSSRLKNLTNTRLLAIPQERLLNAETADNIQRLNLIIENICTAVGLGEVVTSSNEVEHYKASGWQEALGMQGMWSFVWGTDGRFWEHDVGMEWSSFSGFDGEHTWFADAHGYCLISDFDDKEVAIISAWIRTGFWLTGAARDRLNIRLADQSELRKLQMPPLLANEEALALQLQGGKVTAFVVVANDDWLPHKMLLHAYGGTEVWLLRDWLKFIPGSLRRFPTHVTRIPKSGGEVKISATGVEKVGKRVLEDECGMPESKFRKPESTNHSTVRYNSREAPDLKVIKVQSGHILVRPILDGQFVGYFVLDSGASSFTIAASVADKLGMSKFGDVHVIGVDGPSRCPYRRGVSFQLGPLEIDHPLFLELEPAGISKGSENIVGICGYEVFRNAVVEIDGSWVSPKVRLHDPQTYEPKYSQPYCWKNLFFLNNIPFIEGTISPTPGETNGTRSLSEAMKTYFMLDSGAGGVKLILFGRIAKDPTIAKSQSMGFATVKGMGASDGMEVQWVSLPHLEVCGHQFSDIGTLLLPETSTGAVDLTLWAAGLVCADLLFGFTLVLDYSQKRLLLLAVR